MLTARLKCQMPEIRHEASTIKIICWELKTNYTCHYGFNIYLVHIEHVKKNMKMVFN